MADRAIVALRNASRKVRKDAKEESEIRQQDAGGTLAKTSLKN